MREVEATKAKARLAEFLRTVERGESIVDQSPRQAGCPFGARSRQGPCPPQGGDESVHASEISVRA